MHHIKKLECSFKLSVEKISDNWFPLELQFQLQEKHYEHYHPLHDNNTSVQTNM